MCTTIQKFANTGLVYIDQANSNLNGTGNLQTVLISGAADADANGTTVNSVTIKATSNTTQGTVRLFTYNDGNYYLWKEVSIPACTPSVTVASFQATIYESLTLDPGYSLVASTQNAEGFNIFADATDWQNCDCSDDCTGSSQQAFAHTGLVNIATSNPNRDGTGTIGSLITAPTGSLVNGTSIVTIDIKAIETTDQGLIGIYINNGSTNFLVWEVPIPATTQSDVQPAYRTKCAAGFTLQAGYSIGVSTQVANSFNVITFATDITNCSCS